MSVMISVVGSDGRSYSIDPRFNLRFVFPALLEKARLGLERSRWEPWYEDYLKTAGVSEAELLAAWSGLFSYMQSCLHDDQTGPRDALQRSGFLAARSEARLVVLAKLGQLLTASLWEPLRDGTTVGLEPDDARRLDEIARRLPDLLGS